MLANAGSENACREREVEDDLEDEFGQEVGWDSDSDDGSVASAAARSHRSERRLCRLCRAWRRSRRRGGAADNDGRRRRGGGLDPGRSCFGTGTGIPQFPAAFQSSPLPAPFLTTDPEPGRATSFAADAPAAAPIAPPPAFSGATTRAAAAEERGRRGVEGTYPGIIRYF